MPRAGLFFDAAAAFPADRQIRQVAEMRPARVQPTVLAAGWVPVRAGGRKVGRIAPADGMNVDAMHAWRKALNLHIDPNCVGCLAELGRASRATVRGR